MRISWLVCSVSIVVSMGLLLVIMGQYQVLIMLKKRGEQLLIASKTLDDQRVSEGLFKATLEKLLLQGEKEVVDLEAAVAKLSPEIEKKKTENDACQAEKKTKADELAGREKERTENEAALKAESDAWKQETDTLKSQLTEYRPMCDYVKANTLAVKICGTKTS